MRSIEELTEKVHELRGLEMTISSLETRLSILKDEIKEEMEERSVEELVGDDWKVTWKSYTSSRFDQGNFKAIHPDLYEEFKTISESRRFTVK